jgi:MtN3 and saliva related transmembrane protein
LVRRAAFGGETSRGKSVTRDRGVSSTFDPACIGSPPQLLYKTGMDPVAIKLLGFAAATCTTLAYAPQFIKVVRTRSTHDISLAMLLVMVLGLLLWLLYGLLAGDAPLVAANAVTIVLAGGILFMKLKYG